MLKDLDRHVLTSPDCGDLAQPGSVLTSSLCLSCYSMNQAIRKENGGFTLIRRAFTVFSPLLTVLQLHQCGKFDSSNQFVHRTLKNTYCLVFYVHPIWIMDVNPRSRYTAVLLRGHCSNGAVGLQFVFVTFICVVQMTKKLILTPSPPQPDPTQE